MMENNQIVSRMNTYLHTSAKLLEEWLGNLLPKTSDDWWEECVIEKLSYIQRETAKSRGFTKLEDFDLAALLRIADKSWYAMRNVAYLPTRERECIRDMMRVRNNWAHCSAVLPGKDTIIADLTTCTVDVLTFSEYFGTPGFTCKVCQNSGFDCRVVRYHEFVSRSCNKGGTNQLA